MIVQAIRLRKFNRIKKTKANKSRFYCNHCDMTLVGEWGKCPVCRKKNSTKRK